MLLSASGKTRNSIQEELKTCKTEIFKKTIMTGSTLGPRKTALKTMAKDSKLKTASGSIHHPSASVSTQSVRTPAASTRAQPVTTESISSSFMMKHYKQK